MRKKSGISLWASMLVLLSSLQDQPVSFCELGSEPFVEHSNDLRKWCRVLLKAERLVIGYINMGNSVFEYGELWATPSTAQARPTRERA